MSEALNVYCEGITREFPIKNAEPARILKGINLEIPKGELTILRGRSGSGKTTLMNIIGALDMPTGGQVWYDDVEITALKEKERESIRKHDVGFVFQSVALMPLMTAYENVEYALRLTGHRRNTDARVRECLGRVGLSKRMQHFPSELSGGEQQRVAIARAMAHRPKIIFADEPTGELDTRMSMQVVRIFRELTRQENVTVLMTTHNPEVMEIGDTIYEIEDGELVK